MNRKERETWSLAVDAVYEQTLQFNATDEADEVAQAIVKTLKEWGYNIPRDLGET